MKRAGNASACFFGVIRLYLNADECVRLVNACDPGFRNLVRGALLTGCRYSELTSMNATDFNPDAGIVTVRTSKAGKPRHVVLKAAGFGLGARGYRNALAAGGPRSVGVTKAFHYRHMKRTALATAARLHRRGKHVATGLGLPFQRHIPRSRAPMSTGFRLSFRGAVLSPVAGGHAHCSKCLAMALGMNRVRIAYMCRSALLRC
jgi:Phage integrase family